MRVPHFLLFTFGIVMMAALIGCSRESSVKENVNLRNNHSRVFAFKEPIPDPQAFADSMANTAVTEADTIPDTLYVTINDSVYLIGILPYFAEKIYGFQWKLTKPDGKDTTLSGGNARPQVWTYANPGIYEPKFVAFDGNNATDTSGTATRKAWIKVIDTKPVLAVPRDTLWTNHDGDITFPILASDSFGVIKSIKIDLDASGKDSARIWKYDTSEDSDSLYVTIKNSDSKIDSLGNQKIYVIATDDDGNETKDSVYLHFNRIPRLKIIYPQDGARHNSNDRFYFYYEGEDDDNPQDLKYFIYAQASKNGQPPVKALTENDLIAENYTLNIFEPRDKNDNNTITLIKDPNKTLTGRIYWEMYVTDGYDIVRMERIPTDEGSSRPWSFYIGDLSSTLGTFSGVARYQGRNSHSGIHIEFSNGNKTFDAFTDEKGNYSVKVDAGKYTATASPNQAKEYTSVTVEDLVIENGGTIAMDEIVLKDTVPPYLIVKDVDTLTTREFKQSIYARDLGSRLDTVTASIDGHAQKLNCTKLDSNAVFTCPISMNNLTDGVHLFEYGAKDIAGNVTVPLMQTVVIQMTKMVLDVNGGQNARVGEGETLRFTAKITDAYPSPEADTVIWTYDLGNGPQVKKTVVAADSTSATTLGYDDIKEADPETAYIMTAQYKSNGADVKAQVKFGILGDNPAVVFTEPGVETTVSINDPVHFKVATYKGKESVSLTLSWDCGTGLSSGYACPSTDEEADLAFSSVGTHRVSVTVTDNNGAKGNDEVSVTVVKDPPVISATTESKTNEYKINAKVPVKVSASDKYGTVHKIAWACDNGSLFDFGNDTSFAAPQKAVTEVPIEVTLPGSETSNFRCIFKAIDDDGEEGMDTVRFTTLLDLPTVYLSTKKDDVKINSFQTIKANATDKLGYIAEYAYACSDNLPELNHPDWSVFDGPETSVRMPSTATDPYYCVVQVTDDDGNTAQDTATYKVIVGLPSVTAHVNYTRVTINDVVELNAHAFDSLGTLVKYEWGCGAASAQNIGFTFSSTTSPQTTMTMPNVAQTGYKCVVRVTDDDGNTAKSNVEIDIIQAPPSIKIPEQYKHLTVREGYNITLKADAYDNNGVPSDPGQIVKREWSCGGPEKLNWKTVSDFDTVWKAPEAQSPFYCIARATDNDSNMAVDTTFVSFSTEIPLLWVENEVIYVNPGDPFELNATVNDVWQGIDWFKWECKFKDNDAFVNAAADTIKYDYAANGASFKVGKDSSYSEKGKDMYCIISAQETSTKATFSATTEVRLMQYHPVGVITAADTVYLWSGDESVDDNALYFYTPEWGGFNSKLGDLGNKNMLDFRWKFSNVDNNFYQGNKDGSLDTNIAEFNSAFIRSMFEDSMTITLDFRDSTTTAPTQGFYSRHKAQEVSRKVYFRKAWQNQGKDTVIATTSLDIAPTMAIVNNKPVIVYLESENVVAAQRLDGATWKSIGSVTTDKPVTQIYANSHGGNLYMGTLDNSGTLSIYRSTGATSAFATVGTAISNTLAAKIIGKESESNPHVVLLSSENSKIYLYDYNGSNWAKNSNFGTFDGNQTYREFDAVYNDNGELVIMGISSNYTAYYGYYKSNYTQIKWNGFSATDVSQPKLLCDASTIYMGFLSRNQDTYGPRMGKGTFKSNEISWFKQGGSFASDLISEGVLAYHMSMKLNNGIVYAAIDDKGKPSTSQVHVYRYENGKWHLHGENQLPYFKTVFYDKKKYYLRGWSPTLDIDESGKVYLSMLARENAGGANRNNGPLVMKYVADNWEIK